MIPPSKKIKLPCKPSEEKEPHDSPVIFNVSEPMKTTIKMKSVKDKKKH